MATVGGQDFAVCDITPMAALADAQVAIYTTAIRHNGDEHGRPIGALGIFFDWEPQATAIVRGVPLTEEEKKKTRVMLLDAENRIIASSTTQKSLENYPLQANFDNGYYQSGSKIVSYSRTPGYETYRGMGWYGCIETEVDHRK
jgi:hypothetical protein